ncbi:hypothetical protein L596_012290 [Steinernema carpocapsae]|uniref:Uncharacterized protein n=1 Tax=Steinernema carpocapsae TaxID=34508 RepID=A0A4U5NWU8_STECR|nr:hypothetical protein L596_012290 [Steinernema carpocapsae]
MQAGPTGDSTERFFRSRRRGLSANRKQQNSTRIIDHHRKKEAKTCRTAAAFIQTVNSILLPRLASGELGEMLVLGPLATCDLWEVGESRTVHKQAKRGQVRSSGAT